MKVEHVLGLNRNWLRTMIDTITERYGERRYSEYELPYGPADRSLYFPWLLVTVQSSIFEAHHQLRAGMAMALVSGKDWTGYDNGIFGLAVDCTLARLFVSCIDISDREAGPRYLSKKLQAFGLSQGVHVKGLQGILVKIHIWGIRVRKTKLESKIKCKVTEGISCGSSVSRDLPGEQEIWLKDKLGMHKPAVLRHDACTILSTRTGRKSCVH